MLDSLKSLADVPDQIIQFTGRPGYDGNHIEYLSALKANIQNLFEQEQKQAEANYTHQANHSALARELLRLKNRSPYEPFPPQSGSHRIKVTPGIE